METRSSSSGNSQTTVRLADGGRGLKRFADSIDTSGRIISSGRGFLGFFMKERSWKSFNRLTSCSEGDSKGSVKVKMEQQ